MWVHVSIQTTSSSGTRKTRNGKKGTDRECLFVLHSVTKQHINANSVIATFLILCVSASAAKAEYKVHMSVMLFIAHRFVAAHWPCTDVFRFNASSPHLVHTSGPRAVLSLAESTVHFIHTGVQTHMHSAINLVTSLSEYLQLYNERHTHSTRPSSKSKVS